MKNEYYCKAKDILVDKKTYNECNCCNLCQTIYTTYGMGMSDLVRDYKQRLRVKKLNRIL